VKIERKLYMTRLFFATFFVLIDKLKLEFFANVEARERRTNETRGLGLIKYKTKF